MATIVGSGAKHLVQITVDPTTESDAVGESTGSDNAGEQSEQSGVSGPVTAGDVVIATDEYPFWVPDLGQWVDAVDLAPGTWLQTSSGTWVQVSAVQAWTQPATVHNLTVRGVHTYHVAIGNSSPLVHNDDPCGVTSLWNLERNHSIQGNASSRNVCKLADRMKNDGWQVDPIAVVGHGERLLVIDGRH
ncbi:polymorphic toxin-type HINT domain-containing protein [Nocardiopsis sp. CA-288880]|uniref:polymorphic toxin-type HINT domain-containing protein n=1 Tax=Nocardiopsis sp. CA-288880 TaxID=3239995 RepID=UPI003D968076